MTTDNRSVPATFIQAEARDPAAAWPDAPPNFGQDVVPHVVTISGNTGGSGRAYLWADEALRDSRENADKMRTDCGIMECVEARQRSAALLNWHIAPENENSAEEKDLADEMTKIIKRTPHFAKMRWSMGDARWYGRTGIAMNYGKDWVGGRMRTVPRHWEPRHGDKLVFRYDDGSHRTKGGQVGIRIGGSHPYLQSVHKDYLGYEQRKIEATQYGLVYWLDDEQRKLFVVNKHIIEDGPFEDPLRAGAIHGIGIRDRIYWTWYGMIECLADILCYLERSAFGIEIWKYPANNDTARKRVEAAAKNVSSGGRTVLIVPTFSGEDADQFGVQHIEPGLGGVEAAMTIVRQYFGHKIKRYILGQTLSSEAEATGMGSGVADAHLATLADIIRMDALNDEETLSTDFVRPLQLWNFPATRGIYLRFVIDTDSPDAEKKMRGFEAAYGMGARLREEDVLSTIGASAPKATDRILCNPSAGAPPGMGANFGGIQMAQKVPLPEDQQEAIRRVATEEVQKFINGIPLSRVIADRQAYVLSPSEAAKVTARPTEAQIDAGNYRKGKTKLHGLTISIENAKGSKRRPEWPELSAHYGYINGTSGRDGDHVDVYIGPDQDSELVFVIDQQTAAGRFDEHKVVMGTTSERQAVALYKANYPSDWKVGPVTAMTVDQFKAWLASGNTMKPVEGQVSKYEQRWVTIGGRRSGDKEHAGGFPVQIDGEGRILKGGPKGLQGKHVSEIGKHFAETKAARSKDADDFFSTIVKEREAAARADHAERGAGNTRSLKKIVAYQAEKWGMSTETYEQFMEEIWQEATSLQQAREVAKKHARQILKMDAGTLARIEERGGIAGRGGDHSSIPGFDEAARTMADEYPQLFRSGDNEQDLWDLVREGKQNALSRTSREFHDKVDEYLEGAMAAAGDESWRELAAEYEHEAFTANGVPARYTFREEDHPRDDDGTFSLSNKPKRGKTLDIKVPSKAKQRDLFGGRGDAPGQTSFFDDIDPAAKNVPDQNPAPQTTDTPPPVAGSFDELKKRHPELARFADNPDPLPKVKGGQIAHMTDRQHAIYQDLAKARSAGTIGQQEFSAGLAAIRMMNESGNQIAPPSKVKSKLFGAIERAKLDPDKYSVQWNPEDHPRGQPGNPGQFAPEKGGDLGSKANDEPPRPSKTSRDSRRSMINAGTSHRRLRQITDEMFDEAAENLRSHDPVKAEAYVKATKDVTKKLSRRALHLLATEVESVRFYATRAELVAAGHNYGIGPNIVGFYGNDQTLHLNGGTETDKSIKASLAEIYAHEISHHLDAMIGPDEGSSSADWNSAWTAELADGKILPAAAVSLVEGWSEFGELAIMRPAEAERLFPMCYEHWKACGLIK